MEAVAQDFTTVGVESSWQYGLPLFGDQVMRECIPVQIGCSTATCRNCSCSACAAMSTLAGALDETKPSIYSIPKREQIFKEEEDVEMEDAEFKQDQEMDDLFGNDEVEEAKTIKDRKSVV